MWHIHDVNIRELDLNLLVGFEAMIIERSVSGAARRARLSQPAMSNLLARLRKTFEDPLFERAGQRMIPTARARQLAAPIGDAGSFPVARDSAGIKNGQILVVRKCLASRTGQLPSD